MVQINLTAETGASAADVLAGARDFSRHRIDVWPNVSATGYEVHATGETFAEVTETALRGVLWERCRYEWPHSNSVRATVLDSNVLAPGSTWVLMATPNGGGCRVEAVFLRRFRRGPKGRVAKLLNRLAGRKLYGVDLRRALAVIERESAARVGAA
jgi:hypothetical protein